MTTVAEEQPIMSEETPEEISQPSKKKSGFHLNESISGLKHNVVHLMDSSVHTILPHYRLITDENAKKWSNAAVRFAALANALSLTILQPNFPFMCLPGAAEDSFDNTDPFGFSTATYFLLLTALLGSAITSVFVGSLSDRIGRKPLLVFLLAGSTIGSIAKFFARNTFWAFNGVSFFSGFFGSALPIGMAYASDVNHSRAEKDAEIGVLIAMHMVGMSGGGIISILMEAQGLFEPLFVAAGICGAAVVALSSFMIEPKSMLHDNLQTKSPEEEEEDASAPDTINYTLLFIIVAGAFVDNAGSTGLVPITLSPLAFNAFYADFVAAGEEPLMTESAYRWISVMVALTVIPSAGLCQPLYARIGPAGGCVLGNVLTGIITIILLIIGSIEPATNTTFGVFVAALYVGFPFTVISQLSTGPMLDAISPIDKRGLTQGINFTVMSFANALAPWVFGILADEIGTTTTIWICVGISFAAGVVNSPLLFAEQLKRKPSVPDYSHALEGEDEELIAKALQGEWIPRSRLDAINVARMESGKHFLVIPYKPYEEDKPGLDEIMRQSRSDFQHMDKFITSYLGPNMEDPEYREQLAASIMAARPPAEEQQKLKEGLGQWFTDYLEDVGYFMNESPMVYKQLIMNAFPPVNREKVLTGDNIEESIVRFRRVVKKYIAESENPGFIKAFANTFKTS